MHCRIAALAVSLLAPAAAAGKSRSILKTGARPGQVERKCVACHSLDYIQMNSPFLNARRMGSRGHQDDQGVGRAGQRGRCGGDRRLPQEELRQLRFRLRRQRTAPLTLCLAGRGELAWPRFPAPRSSADGVASSAATQRVARKMNFGSDFLRASGACAALPEGGLPMFVCSLSWTDRGCCSVKDAPKRAAASRETRQENGCSPSRRSI